MASTDVTTMAAAVPLLRRFSRALLGDRDVADDYVALALERGAAQGAPATPTDLKLDLLRLLYETAFDQPPPPAPRPAEGLPAAVMRLPLPNRAALLLRALEGMTFAETATVLSVAETDAARLYRQAVGRLRRFCFGNVLVVEFDGRYARYLTRLVRKAGYTVIGTATSRDEAIALTAHATPGLIVADVGGKGDADTLGWLHDHWTIPIVLIRTAEEHACTSHPFGIASVNKPFEPQALRDALARIIPA